MTQVVDIISIPLQKRRIVYKKPPSPCRRLEHRRVSRLQRHHHNNLGKGMKITARLLQSPTLLPWTDLDPRGPLGA